MDIEVTSPLKANKGKEILKGVVDAHVHDKK